MCYRELNRKTFAAYDNNFSRRYRLMCVTGLIDWLKLEIAPKFNFFDDHTKTKRKSDCPTFEQTKSTQTYQDTYKCLISISKYATYVRHTTPSPPAARVPGCRRGSCVVSDSGSRPLAIRLVGHSAHCGLRSPHGGETIPWRGFGRDCAAASRGDSRFPPRRGRWAD